jgi:hypothetical protein
MNYHTTYNTNYCCILCEKKYTRKSSYDKHVVLCDFLFSSKREKQITNQETEDMPSYHQLVNIVQELTIKYSQMENKLAAMQKWVEKKKKKINVIQWLNNNSEPTSQAFEEWIKNINIQENHFEYLMKNNIVETVQCILEEYITNSNSNIPIKCFSQKTNCFYIYENNNEWRQMIFEDYTKLLNIIQRKLLITLTDWREKNKDEIEKNDGLSILYNKTIIKLMNMNIGIVHDTTSNKIKINLYNYLKMDLKNLIEYDFEF